MTNKQNKNIVAQALLGSISNYGELLTRLFPIPKNNHGYYEVIFFINGWKRVIVDDYIPIYIENDIIYGLAFLSHYVIAVMNEYMKMYDLKDPNYKEVKSIFIKDVFFYCVDTTFFNNIYYVVMGGNANSIFL